MPDYRQSLFVIAALSTGDMKWSDIAVGGVFLIFGGLMNILLAEPTCRFQGKVTRTLRYPEWFVALAESQTACRVSGVVGIVLGVVILLLGAIVG